MCDKHSKSPALAAIENFQPRIITPHKPEIMCITCIDGREGAGRYLNFNDDAIRVTEIASVIPPYESSPASLRAKFSFTKIKGISTVKIIGHSFCGGAETAIANPDPANIANPEVRDIVDSLAQSGADLKRLCRAFLLAAEGNSSHAANLLSRHLVLVSTNNIAGYPQIGHDARERKIDLLPLYHVMKQGTGEFSHLERYDLDQQRWLRTDAAPEATHMCARQFNCQACTTCHDAIGSALAWTPLEYLRDDGRQDHVEVPLHIANMVRARRSFFQPGLTETIGLGCDPCPVPVFAAPFSPPKF